MVLEYILGHLEVIHKKKDLLFLYCAFSVLSLIFLLKVSFIFVLTWSDGVFGSNFQ